MFGKRPGRVARNRRAPMFGGGVSRQLVGGDRPPHHLQHVTCASSFLYKKPVKPGAAVGNRHPWRAVLFLRARSSSTRLAPRRWSPGPGGIQVSGHHAVSCSVGRPGPGVESSRGLGAEFPDCGGGTAHQRGDWAGGCLGPVRGSSPRGGPCPRIADRDVRLPCVGQICCWPEFNLVPGSPPGRRAGLAALGRVEGPRAVFRRATQVALRGGPGGVGMAAGGGWRLGRTSWPEISPAAIWVRRSSGGSWSRPPERPYQQLQVRQMLRGGPRGA